MKWGSEFLVVFVATMVLPSLLLVVFGIRSLVQERQVGNQRTRESLNRVAVDVEESLQRELEECRTGLRNAFSGGPPDAQAETERIRLLRTDPDSGVVLTRADGRLTAWPDRRLLYALEPPASAAPTRTSPRIAAADALEVREKDFRRAADAYIALLRTADVAERALLLSRVARTLRKANDVEGAVAAYRRLGESKGLIAGIPAELVAKHELSDTWPAGVVGSAERLRIAADAFLGLTSGRWMLDRGSYLFYSERFRARLAELAPASRTRSSEPDEERKRAMTEAAAEVAQILGSNTVRNSTLHLSSDASHVAVIAPSIDARPSIAAVLPVDRLTRVLWPDTMRLASSHGFAFALRSPVGTEIVASSTRGRRGSEAAGWLSTGEIRDGNAAWRLTVWPTNPAAMSADIDRRQRWYFVLLGLVVSSLGFGIYLTQRVVKRELEIAELKANFVSTVSHEFRSPLTGIRQLAELLMSGRVPDERRRQDYYVRITHESDRLARLVENVLDVSRMEAGRRQYRFERFDPCAWLADVVGECDARFAAQGITIVRSATETLPPIVGDRAALACAIQNLIDNAVKYSPGRDTVWVTAEAARATLKFAVRDEGVGIPAADRQHIFGRFQRGTGDITRQVKGAGLGLSLVEHIVRAHGGRVAVESEPGLGSTFTIELPADRAS